MRMRKTIRVVLLAAVLLGLLVSLVACGSTTSTTSSSSAVKITSLTVHSNHKGDYILGEDVDFSEIIVTASYSDGKTKQFTLYDDLLSDEDKAGFFIVGVHKVTVNYEGKQAVFQISVSNPNNVTLYCAQFFSDGGSPVDTMYAETIKAFRVPEKEGYTFVGWYTTVDKTGSKAIAPYTLKENTNFYAKWEDNRRCYVRFIDEGEILYQVEVVYGSPMSDIRIDDEEIFPDPEEKEGKIFKGWRVIGGGSDVITEDIRVTAVYETINFTIQIEYWDGEKLTKTAKTINYGSRFTMTDAEGNPLYTLPTIEGYTSRWVIYPKDSDKFIEFPENQDYVVVKEEFSIRAQHDINTYSVTIFNGIEEENQADADLKSGDIKSERIYFDSQQKTDFRVNYGSSFLLSNYTQTPYLKDPVSINGYNVCWCYVITTLTGEEWRNKDNKVWDEETQSFVLKEGDEVTSNYELYDRDGNYLCIVRNGDLYNIKGNVTVRAKYYKKDYTVRLQRRVGNRWVEIGTFTEKYRTDFQLYDPAKYAGSGMTTSAQVESYYLLNNVVRWSFDDDVFLDWRSLYYNGGNDDDWAIEWYTASSQDDEFLVDFTEKNNGLGSYEITKDLALYCKDIDLRRYTVTLFYGYDFAGNGAYVGGAYKYRQVYEEIPENEEIIRSNEREASIMRIYPEYDNKSVTYEFDNWYDFPYEPNGNGEKGTLANFESRTRNIVYYAHYKCETTYSVTINDRTQREKYVGTALDNKNFDVPYHTIEYTVQAGTLFTSDMIYKGIKLGENSFLSGQELYERASFMEAVLGLESGGSRSDPKGTITENYHAVVLRYDAGGNPSTALANARAELAIRQAAVETYRALLSALYTYDYTVNGELLDKELFMEIYTSPTDGYHALRRNAKDVENDIEVLTSYQEQLERAQQYYDENETGSDSYTVGSTTVKSGKYKRYSDSVRDLNAAYNKDISDPTEKVKFKFSGWYLDAEYTEPFDGDSRDLYFTFFASVDSFTGGRTYLDLYAKWADEEKGSEGLVFKAIYDQYGSIVGVVVVDYMTSAEYEVVSFAGCGYNNFDVSEYSVNFNDSELMPNSLGTNIDLQVPAGHGGLPTNPYPVLGIMANAFVRHGSDIKTIALPDGVVFFEEEALHDCYLTGISGSSNDTITIEDQRVLYQTAPVAGYYQKIDNVLTEIEIAGKTLIAYASKFATTASVDGTKVVIRSGIERIGNYAFYSANQLQQVKLNDQLIEIGEYAFKNSGICGTDADNNDTLILPDSLVSIGRDAFANCVGIRNVQVTGSSSLDVVGRGALTDTAWYNTKKGVIALNGLVLGVRDCSESDFDTDGGTGELVVVDGMHRYTDENGYGAIYYDETNGKSILRIDLYDTIRGIADYAFESQVDNGGSLNKKVTAAVVYISIDSELTAGVAQYAFLVCASLETVEITSRISGSATIDQTAFSGCGRPTVIVHKNLATLDSSWREETGWDLVLGG